MTVAPERLVRVRLCGFRGVAGQFELSFPDRRSLVVFAENGNGKSTIADALEWYFTGKIESLRREDREQNVRHIKATARTLVEVQTTGLLSGAAGLPHPGTTPATLVGQRELFLLRGRDLAEFIDMTKMDKWKSLAKLLGFAAVDALRADLQTAMHELARAAVGAESAARAAANSLAKTGPAASPSSVLRWLQVKCRSVGATPPLSFEAVLDPTWHPVPESDAVVASAQRTTLAAELVALVTPTFAAQGIKQWNEVMASATTTERARGDLFRAAERQLPNLEADRCPLCERPILLRDLASRIRKVLADLALMSERLQEADKALRELTSLVQESARARLQLARTAKRQGVVLAALPKSPDGDFASSLAEQRAIDASKLSEYVKALARWDAAARAAGETLKAQLADQGIRQIAEVIAVRDSARRWDLARVEAERARQAADASTKLHDAFDSAFRERLQGVLDRISGRVGDLYARLHPTEGVGTISVETLDDKGVELALDFHGFRQRPPNGVLSESHLHSLGLALFLAMSEAANEQLGFLVLDDPISSLDAAHRARLAELLVDQFASRQLVVLTHDWPFFERLAHAGWQRLEFISWTFESGPITKDRDPSLMARARADLVAADLEGAANKGRQALEAVLKEICERLEAPIAYRRGSANDLRMSDELIAGLRRVLKGPAKAIRADLDMTLRAIEADLAAALNVESHDSVHRVSPNELEAALDRIVALDAYFQCGACDTRVWRFGSTQSFRCRCGAKTLSLEAPSVSRGTSA